MFSSPVIEVVQRSLYLIILLSAPPVLAAATIGILIALLQAATQIQEQTIQFAAKLLAVFMTILIFGAIASEYLMNFTNYIFSSLNVLVESI